MGKTPKPPPALDPNAVAGQARTQNTQNAQENAAFNRINQYGPYGSTEYSQTGTDANGNPIFAQTTTLDPREKAMREQGQGYWQQGAGGIAQMAANGPNASLSRTLHDPEGLTQMGANRLGQFNQPGNLSSNDAFDRAYGYASANLEPRFERTRAAEENRLRNQGLDPTSEAYKSQMNDVALQQNEARNNLVTGLQGQMFNQGIAQRQNDFGEASNLFGMGTGRAGQVFGQDQAIAGLQGQNYDRQLGAYQSLGGMGLQGAGSVATSTGAPGYSNVGVQNVDVAGLQNQARDQQMQIYQQQNQNRNAMIGGLAGLGGTLLTAGMGGGLGGMMSGGLSRMTGGYNAGGMGGLGGSLAMGNYGNVGQSSVGAGGMPALGGLMYNPNMPQRSGGFQYNG